MAKKKRAKPTDSITKEKEEVMELSFFEDWHDGKERIYEEVIINNVPKFVYLNNNQPHYIEYMTYPNGTKIIPVYNAAITEKAVLLPTGVQDYGNIQDLIKSIRKHIHKYVDLSPEFETFSSYYILMSWVCDKLNTLCYLRFLGDTGTGKSRALDTIGRLCYKPCIVSGAVTPAPIYRMIKKWGGTIILDEADFHSSDVTNEVITILNCGFERGRPVIRCTKEDPDNLQFLPTFGPKVIATRYSFKDKALESRSLTHKMIETSRKEIPPILPPEFYEEEEKLRQMLLMFRLKHRESINPDLIKLIDLGDVESRIKQATSSFAVLFANIPEMLEKFKHFLKEYNQELVEERSQSFEGMIVQSIFDLIKKASEKGEEDFFITSKDIAEFMFEEFKLKDAPSTRTIGKHLKSLGIVSEPKKIKGKTFRMLVLNGIMLQKLYRRYVSASLGDDWGGLQLGLQSYIGYVSYMYTETMGGKNNNNNNRLSSPDAQYPVTHVTNVTDVTEETIAPDISDEELAQAQCAEIITTLKYELSKGELNVESFVSRFGEKWRDFAEGLINKFKREGLAFEHRKGMIKLL